MTNIAVKRIQKEFREVTNSEEVANGTLRLELRDGAWSKLKGQIVGPSDTPYEGGKFDLDIEIPNTYPFYPPKMRFMTKIWHPNISSVTGAICLDILGDQWAAALTIRTVLLSLQALLSAPEPNDPQDGVVAKQYLSNLQMFKCTARHWTNVYANGPHVVTEYNTKIDRLLQMGIDEQKARVALSSNNWDLETATQQLFSM